MLLDKYLSSSRVAKDFGQYYLEKRKASFMLSKFFYCICCGQMVRPAIFWSHVTVFVVDNLFIHTNFACGL